MAVKFLLHWWDDKTEQMTAAFHDHGPIVARCLPRIGERVRLAGDRFYEVVAVEHQINKIAPVRAPAKGPGLWSTMMRTFGYTPFPEIVPEHWADWGTVDIIKVAVRPLL